MLFNDVAKQSPEARQAIRALQHAQQNFSNATAEYVDKAIYELSAAERGLVNVMQEARKRCVGDGFKLEDIRA